MLGLDVRVVDSNLFPSRRKAIDELGMYRVFLIRFVFRQALEVKNECPIVTPIDHWTELSIRWLPAIPCLDLLDAD